MKKTLLLFLGVFIHSAALAGEALPYSVDFRQDSEPEGWKTLDANGDNQTWGDSFGMNNGLFINYPAASNDDWLFSPDFPLERSVEYRVTVTKEMMGAPAASAGGKIEVYVGKGEDPAAYRVVGALDLTMGVGQDEISFSVQEIGECKVALRNTLSNLDPLWFIQCILVEKDTEATVDPAIKLKKDFSADRTADGWTVIDGNEDGAKWGFIDGAEGISLPMSQNGNADDWLISPVVSGVEKGRGYILSFSIGANGGFEDELVDVYYGAANTQNAMTRKITSEVIPSGSKATRYFRIFPDTEDGLCIGLHGVSPAQNGTVTLSDILLEESEGVRPVAPEAFSVKSNIKAGQVTLSWINPTTDAENIAIGSEVVHIDIWRDDVKIQTIEGSAGSPMTYVDEPLPFEGETTYKIEAWCEDGLLSEPASQTITLDDFQGDPKSLAVWGGTGNGSFTDWTIANVDGYLTYEYVEWNNSMQIKTKSSRDDWMISPAVSLASNRRYIIRAEIQASVNLASDFELTIGTDATPESAKVIKEFSAEGNGTIVYETDQFGIESGGEYHIGLRCTGNRNITYIQKIELLYLENAADPENLPFVEDFREADALTDWILSEQTSFSLQNADGMDGNSLVSASTGEAERNEIVFSPMISFRAGYTYEVAFDYSFEAEADENNRFDFFMSAGQSAAELIQATEQELTGIGRAAVKFTPEQDGTYCLAFRIVAESGNDAVAAIDNLEVGKKVFASLPYAEDFEDYTTINSVPVGWENAVIATDAVGGNVVNLSGTAKTPVFTHSEMRDTYNLAFKMKKGEETVTVKVTDGEKTETIAELTGEMTDWTDQTIAITPLSTEEPFDFWILFECGGENVNMDEVEISMAERVIEPGAPVDLSLSYSYTTGNWNFSWKNPKSDAEGYELNRDVTVKVFYKDTVLASATGEPGAGMSASCQFEENYENGVMIFRAVASVEGTDGLAATTVLKPESGKRYTVEKAAFDFSDDEAWENTGWTKGEGCLTTSKDAVLTSPDIELENGKLYAVDYSFVASPDETASFAVAVLNEQGETLSEQVFAQVYLGVERDGAFPDFTMELPRMEADGKYRIELTASDVNSSVSVKSVSVLELREYPSNCEIPYFNDFEDMAIETGGRQPNWTLYSTNNTSTWSFAELDGVPVNAYSGERAMVAGNTENKSREDWLYTPYFTFQSGKHYSLEFQYFIEGENSTLALVYAIDPTYVPGEYQTLEEFSKEKNSGNNWKSYSLPLDPVDGDLTVTFGFVGLSNAASDGIIAIDDFRITEREPQGAIESVNGNAEVYFADGRLYVPTECLEIKIFNAQGQMVYSGTANGTCIAVPDFPKGIYIVKVNMDGASVQTVKIIK